MRKNLLWFITVLLILSGPAYLFLLSAPDIKRGVCHVRLFKLLPGPPGSGRHVLCNRIGAKNGLILVDMVMALLMIVSGLVEGPLLISITKLLHAVELPILLVSIFKYNMLNFDKCLSSTIYLVGFACTSSIIGTVLSPLAGFSYEKFGFAQSYRIMGIMVLCTTFISVFLLRSNKSSTEQSTLQQDVV